MYKKITIMVFIFVMVVVVMNITQALFANIWTGFLLINNSPAAEGSVVKAYNLGGNLTSGSSIYPLPDFLPSSKYAVPVEGEEGGLVYFKVNNLVVDQEPQTITANPNPTVHNLNLTVTDSDGDGFAKGYAGYAGADKDCNDSNPNVNPGMHEILGNGIDDDCNASTYDNFEGNSDNISGNLGNFSIDIGGSNNLSEFLTGEHTVKFNDGGKILAEFKFDFTGNYINLSSLTIKEDESANVGSIVIGGLDLGANNNKTVYVKKLSNLTTLCIKDADITSVSQISALCNGASEFSLNCPGNNSGYECTFNSTTNSFKVTGLRHSGVQQQTYCGDGTCNGGESCSSCPSDCGSCSTTTTTGGGGGGGGCLPQWQCTDWSACANGLQARTCTNLKSYCSGIKPAEEQACTAVTAVTPTTPTTPITPTTAPITGAATAPTSSRITGTVIGKLAERGYNFAKKNIGVIIIGIFAIFIIVVFVLSKPFTPRGNYRKAAGLHKKGEIYYNKGNTAKANTLFEKANRYREIGQTK